MKGPQWFAVLLLTGAATVVQTSLLPSLGLATGSSVLVFIIVIALASRVEFHEAVAIGTLAGLLVDLTPPAAGPLGINALLGTLIAVTLYGWARLTSADTASTGATLLVYLVAIAGISVLRAAVSGFSGAAVPFVTFTAATGRDLLFSLIAIPVLVPLINVLVDGSAASRGSSTYGSRARYGRG